jgi:fatty acid desaturase
MRGWVWHISGLPYWISGIRLILRLATGRETAPFIAQGARRAMQTEAQVLIGLYLLAAATLYFSPLILWLWLVPVLLGQPFLRLYLLAEHGDCPQVTNMFSNTRTTFTTALVRFLAWNMPYHTEHHVWPQVPFHRLPDLHRLMKSHLGVTADGYAAFTKSYLNRRSERAPK